MSQVDYIHFFSNVFWSSIFFWLVYILICTFFVQNFYKIFRLRFFVFYYIYLLSKLFNLNWNSFVIFTMNNNLILKLNYYSNLLIFSLKLKKYFKILCL